MPTGGLPDRLYLLGLDGGSDSYHRDLALQADRDTDSSDYDRRFVAEDTTGRPLWAKGAIVLVWSTEPRRLHMALEACSIVLSKRYLVVPEECASRVVVAMKSRAEM